MPSEVLYRKYRPHTFAEVAGQKHIVAVLENEVAAGNFAHAYLFSGSRGTGKTSVARILARALGCTDQDMYEIDAASNTGVDDVRELRDGVRTLPFESPVKVYIIDEVHMLSKQAFNALLKTLEEPPKHVVFILATTELHKVLDTIVSRCETFVFRRPSTEVLSETIKQIAKKEKTKIEPAATTLIAFLSDGSFRDALGLLQKVLAAGAGRDITATLVEEVSGLPEISLIHDFLTALLEAEAPTALSILARVTTDGCDLKSFSKRVLAELRLVMLLKYGPELAGEIKAIADAERFEFFTRLASHQNSAKISGVLKELLDSYDQIGLSFLPQLPLEIAVVNIFEKLK